MRSPLVSTISGVLLVGVLFWALGLENRFAWFWAGCVFGSLVIRWSLYAGWRVGQSRRQAEGVALRELEASLWRSDNGTKQPTLDHLHTILAATNRRLLDTKHVLELHSRGGDAVNVVELEWTGFGWESINRTLFPLGYLSEAADFITNYRKEKS